MIRLDFREQALINRVVAKRDLEEARQSIRHNSGDILIDIGSNVATTSWVDAFLAPLVASIDRPVTVIVDSNVTRSHIERVFQVRGGSVRVARNEADAIRGAVDIIPAA